MGTRGVGRSSLRSVLALIQACVLLTALPAHPSERFRHLTIRDGLAQNSAYALAQDHQGYVWIGTQEGLHRYDGLRLETYRWSPEDPDSIGASSINAVLPRADGDLWVAHAAGLDLLRAGTGRFEHLPAYDPDTGQGLRASIVEDLVEDRGGRLWIAGDAGLERYDPSTTRWDYYGSAEEAAAFPLAHSYELELRADGSLWIGSEEGLFHLDPATGAVPVEYDWGDDAEGYAGEPVYTLFEDRAGGLWVGHWWGLSELAANGTRRHWPEEGVDFEDRSHDYRFVADGAYPVPLLIMAITQVASGELWLATIGDGLVRLDPESGRTERVVHDPTDPTSLSEDSLSTLMSDRTGLIWIGTDGGGVNILDPAAEAFTNFGFDRDGDAGGLPDQSTWGLLADDRDRLWVATQEGLALLEPGADELRVFHHEGVDLSDLDSDDPYELAEAYWERWRQGDSLPSDWISTVIQSSDGSIWIATESGLGRYLEDGRWERHIWPSEEPLGYDPALDVLSVVEFDGALWASTFDGLVRYDPSTGSSLTFREGDEHAPGYAGAPYGEGIPLPDGTLLLLQDQGPLVLERTDDGYRFQRFDSPGEAGRALREPAVSDALLREDELWLGTSSGLHLLSLSRRTVQRVYTADDGLPSDVIYAIEEDAAGNIWVSTTHGLSQFDRIAHSFRNYDYSDGLQNDEYNGGSSARFADGRLAFGGVDGLSIFDPAEVKPNAHRPRVAITRFYRYDEELDIRGLQGPDGVVELSHEDDVIALEFVAFDFAAPERNRFEFKLDGFDPFWRFDVSGNRATYTNLDAGEYLFRVRGTNRDGVWSAEEATLRIRVLPAPWETWWAYTAYWLSGFALLYLGWRFQRYRLLRENALREETQRRNWAETLNRLTQSLLGTLDDSEISDHLLDNLGWVVPFDRAALFMEQGTELALVSSRGLSDGEVLAYRLLPEDQPQRIANLRNHRAPMPLTPANVEGTALGSIPGLDWLAVPLSSRSDDFALLFIGRSAGPFEAQEQAMAASFAQQAVVALESASLFAEVQSLAITDGLTRLATRRHFLELAELEYTRSRRYDRELSVMMLDADTFKSVNDGYGHEVGDRVLKLIASVCRTNLRHFDIIGRYGGEEFVVALPETSCEVAAEVAERIRRHVEELVITTHQGDLSVTLSIGVAALAGDVGDLGDLIHRADSALYEAKRAGRNLVQVHHAAASEESD